jgi:hypothetical protein
MRLSERLLAQRANDKKLNKLDAILDTDDLPLPVSTFQRVAL